MSSDTMLAPEKTDINAFKKTLVEFGVYEVDVAHKASNPVHKAILHNGFDTGSYSVVFNNTYEQPVELHKVYYIANARLLTVIK